MKIYRSNKSSGLRALSRLSQQQGAAWPPLVHFCSRHVSDEHLLKFDNTHPGSYILGQGVDIAHVRCNVDDAVTIDQHDALYAHTSGDVGPFLGAGHEQCSRGCIRKCRIVMYHGHGTGAGGRIAGAGDAGCSFSE